MVIDDNGNTLLHFAARYGQLKAVQHLARKETIGIDCLDNNGSTPLHLAALEGHNDTLRVLIEEFNSDPLIKGYVGQTILHYACKNGDVDLVDEIIARYGRYGLDPMTETDYRNTTLHIAARYGQVATVKHLITKHSAKVDCRNSQHCTPLCEAVLYGHKNVMDLLIQEFASDPHVKGFTGRTLLHFATQGGHIKLIDKLITKYKLDLMARDDNNNTLLHFAARYGQLEAVKHLALTVYKISIFCVNAIGNTPLHLATIGGHNSCVELLLFTFNAPIFVKNKSGLSAFEIAKYSTSRNGVYVLYQRYLKEESSEIQRTYQEHGKLVRKEYSGHKHIGRLFLMGHPAAGKTTLIKTLKSEGLISKISELFGYKTVVAPHTAGIVPSTFDSDQFGRMIFFDFAGDSEYYSSHAAIFENLDTSKGASIFLIVCDLAQNKDVLITRYGYWLSFLSYNTRQSSMPTLVLPIGSHADMINKQTASEKLSLLDKASQQFNSTVNGLHIRESIALDCRRTGTIVDSIKERVREASSSVPTVGLSLECTVLLGLLLKDFISVPACTIKTISSHIELVADKFPLSSDSQNIFDLLKELHEFGLLLLIKMNCVSIEDYWVVLNVLTLTSEVHSKLFSPIAKTKLADDVNQLKLSVGIIPELLLEKLLPDYITKECLIQLQYCQEINDVHVDSDHTLTQVHSDERLSRKSLLFFPALCELSLEDISWPANTDRQCALGWYVKCANNNFDYFPSRFLHVLIVRLSLSFALKQRLPTNFSLSSISDSICSSLTSLSSHASTNKSDTGSIASLTEVNRRCHVWTTGLHWLMENGVEVFVDMPKDTGNKGLVVVTRSSNDCRVECANTLQKVIQKIVEAKVEFCHCVSPAVYLLDPTKLRDMPFINARDVPLYTLSDVEAALAEGYKRAVSIDGHHFSSPAEFTLTRWTMSYWSE